MLDGFGKLLLVEFITLEFLPIKLFIWDSHHGQIMEDCSKSLISDLSDHLINPQLVPSLIKNECRSECIPFFIEIYHSMTLFSNMNAFHRP